MHDDIYDHDHPDNFVIGEDEIVTDIEGLEMFSLKSVGIDIGSSTSHLIFSHITLRREGASLSGKFKVTNREVLYRSPIMLTPYISATKIDTDKVNDFIHAAYKDAGLTPEDVDTGAVIITGEALKKENAQPIVENFAKYSGKFICAAAGHNHEALLAAYGCGAVDLSKSEHKTVLNVDMGGGTTKFSLVEDGVVAQTASINVGARLIAFDEEDKITRIEDAGRTMMKEVGYKVEIGQKITDKMKEDFGAYMAKILFEIIEEGPHSAMASSLMVTPPFVNYRGFKQVQHIVFSGGVSEHVYDRDPKAYGDIGPVLGKNMREYLKKLPKDVLREPIEGIRATVIGAGEYTIQASGNTSYVSNEKALPVHGLKVIQAPIRDGESVSEALKHVRLGSVSDRERCAGLSVRKADCRRCGADSQRRRRSKMSTLSDLGPRHRQVARRYSQRRVPCGAGYHRDRRHRSRRLGLHRYRRMLGHHRSHSRHRQVADVSDDPCRLAEF